MRQRHISSAVIEPDFAPGRGWHKIDGLYSPGSETDLEKRRERAWPCWVLQMRDKGVRIAPDLLLEVEPLPGLFLATQSAGRWTAALLDRGDITRELLHLAYAEPVRENDGVRLIRGLERDAGVPAWQQTWLCTPTRERAREIVQAMAERDWPQE